jgi:hypothetical protein
VHKIVKPVSGVVVGIALCFSSTMASAATLPTTANYTSASISPFVALSAYGTVQSQSAVCAATAGSAGAAAAGQTAAPGCVLPVLDPAAAPVAVDTAAPVAAPVAYVAPSSGFGFGIGAIVAGLALVAGLAAVLATSHNKGRLPISPD